MAYVRTGLFAVLLVALTGCTGPLPSTPSAPGGSTPTAAANEDTLVPQTAAPPTLEPVPQRPVDRSPVSNGSDDGPYLAVPTAPAGAEHNDDEAPAAGVHCIGVNYLSNKPTIPTGVHVIVTSVRITDGSKYFRTSGTGCSRPPCPGFVWADSDATCDVPLVEKGGWSDEKQVTLLVARKDRLRTAEPGGMYRLH